MQGKSRHSCLLVRKAVHAYAEQMEAEGIQVEWNREARTVEGKDSDGATVFRAMAKDANTWIATFLNSPCVVWGF